jgi:hypothetical protein
MNWYEWETIEQFNAWHDALCVELAYPIYGVNEATGQIDTSAQATTAYTSAFEVGSKFIAVVEDAYAQNLTPTNLRPARRIGLDEA